MTHGIHGTHGTRGIRGTRCAALGLVLVAVAGAGAGPAGAGLLPRRPLLAMTLGDVTPATPELHEATGDVGDGGFF